MKVLVACEYSGIVRDAFLKKGHDAISCDLLPTESDGPHYQGDVFDIINDGFDLMIAHPPCTFLSNSGVRWLYEQSERMRYMEEGADFFLRLLNADIPKIAIENPVMHGYAVDIIGRKHDQTIQPYQFGHSESKRTCLWLKDLPCLFGTDDCLDEMKKLSYAESHKVHFASPGPNRQKIRSRFFTGIAAAMAEQWSN